jgi:hypothetical protein
VQSRNTLLSGPNTVEVARLDRVSRMWIYQQRMDLLEDWEKFNGERA